MVIPACADNPPFRRGGMAAELSQSSGALDRGTPLMLVTRIRILGKKNLRRSVTVQRVEQEGGVVPVED
ncbi:protein of unknown function [Candidatus Filomicrobium marinum]|nr:protein of unknown function [Candidatus Filomicrobium marinum]